MTDRIVPVLLAATLTLVSPASGGETYRWVDDQGNVTYSNRPPQPRETGVTTPETKPAPDARAPEAKAPELKAPEPKAPEARTPEPKGPDPQTSPPKARDAKAAVRQPRFHERVRRRSTSSSSYRESALSSAGF